jgi:hypothetical protein
MFSAKPNLRIDRVEDGHGLLKGADGWRARIRIVLHINGRSIVEVVAEVCVRELLLWNRRNFAAIYRRSNRTLRAIHDG